MIHMKYYRCLHPQKGDAGALLRFNPLLGGGLAYSVILEGRRIE